MTPLCPTIQKTLAHIHHTQGLDSALATLHAMQIDSGVLSKDTLADLTTLTPVYQEDHLLFYLQHNPHRIHRGISKTPHPSPKHRIQYSGGVPCFLCVDNIAHGWPEERGYRHQIATQDMVFLPNIAPLFPCHFTLASHDHIPQDMHLSLLYETARLLPTHWVIQNGPDAGATNPEHLHLQTFSTASLPTDLPILTRPYTSVHTHLDLTISKVNHPATVYRYEWSSENSLVTLTTLLENYLSKSPHHRVNLMMRTHPTIQGKVILFILFRHTQKRTTLYLKGQPGYAEASGLISTTTPDHHQRWLHEGISLYHELMGDIQIDLGGFESYNDLKKAPEELK
jgi:hypothetical protein